VFKIVGYGRSAEGPTIAIDDAVNARWTRQQDDPSAPLFAHAPRIVSCPSDDGEAHG